MTGVADDRSGYEHGVDDHHGSNPGGVLDRHDHDGHDHGDHDHGDHGHDHSGPWWKRHSHDAADRVDSALEDSRAGVRALIISLLVLGLTAAMQAVVVVVSGSIALLGDTLHNVADALTALPLWLAFVVGRRRPTRRYTYGYGRAEDLAGIFIVLAIVASTAIAAYEALDRLLNPRSVDHLWAVAIAALIGFAGNEAVAVYRIRVGRRIGSAALEADGHHARTDGLTSLAVLLGAAGSALGWELADPIVGLAITVAILFVLKDAARDVYRRLMDAVAPSRVDAAERSLAAVDGVVRVGEVRIRWIGHRLRAEVQIEVDGTMSTVDSHAVALAAEHALLHDVPRLSSALVHADPATDDGIDHHAETAHHRVRE